MNPTNRYQVSLFRHSNIARQVAAGTAVFRAGEPSRGLMYVIRTGKVALVINGKEVDYMGPDEVFGEMALLEKLPRLADVVAIEDTELSEINDVEFTNIVRANPHFALQMMKILSARLRSSRSA